MGLYDDLKARPHVAGLKNYIKPINTSITADPYSIDDVGGHIYVLHNTFVNQNMKEVY